MLYTGYSIEVDDCIAIPKATIEKVVSDSIPSDIEEQPQHVIMEQLNNAKDKIMGMTKRKLCRDGQVHRFMVSVKSGASGSFFNMCQMTGMQGQQYINGARLSDPSMFVQDLHQKGFITGSFGTGLSPKELFLHAQSGRTSPCDTILTTSQTG